MKILSLTLQNLNSLKGKWYIDFTDPAFEDSGIFAITGQTGAGKTTILDAICLALYGRTPRVEITKTNNEVMSRGCFECMAEVEIDINGTLYRCHWLQHRAYKKADGNLRDIQHTISKINHPGDTDGKVIESKATLTKATIINTVGMDFEQFTRSVMLAQGQFATFLKAKSHERANILEKITGTKIYAEISRRVHIKNNEHKQKLNQLTATLDGMELLSDEKIAEINQQLGIQQTEQKTYKATLNSLTEQINWQKNISKLTTDIHLQQEELNLAKHTQTEFKSDAFKLQQALKALEIESLHQQLENMRHQLDERKNKQNQLNEQLPTQQQKLQTATQQLNNADTTVNEAQSLLNQQLPIIETVKTLDNTLAQSLQLIEHHQSNIEKLTINKNALLEQITANKQTISQNNITLDNLNKYLTNNAHHANLGTDKQSFYKVCQNISKLLADNTAANDELITCDQQAKTFKQQNENLNNQQQQVNKQIIDNEKQSKKLQNDLDALLQNKTIQQWHEQVTELNNDYHQIIKANEQHQQLSHFYTNSKQLKNEQLEITSSKQQLSEEKDKLLTTLDAIKDKLADKQATLKLQQQVIKLEQYIVELHQGDACPVCGANEHPYLTDLNNGSHPHFNPKNNQLSQLNELQQTIKELEQQVDIQQTEISENEKSLTAYSIKLEETSKQQTSLAKQMLNIIDNVQQTHPILINDLYQDDIDDEFIQLLSNNIAQLQTDNQQKTKRCKDIIKAFDQLEQQLKQNKQTEEKLQQDLQKIKDSLNDITNQNNLHTQKYEQLSLAISNHFKQLTTEVEELNILFDQYQAGLPTALNNSIQKAQILDASQTDLVMVELRDIAKNWNNKEKIYTDNLNKRQTLDIEITSQQSKLSELEKQLELANNEIKQLSEVLAKQQDTYQNKLTERQNLFAAKNPVTEEQALRTNLANAQKAFTEAKENQQDLKNSVDNITTQLNEITTWLASNQTNFDEQSIHFDRQLMQQGFSNKQAFAAARLSKEEREQLQTKQRDIDAKVERLQTLLDNSTHVYNELKNQALTTTPLQELLQQQQLTETKEHELAKQIGANQQILEENNKNQTKHQQQQQLITQQRQANQAWEQLNQLIGSSDGKKFRTFAQGITFDAMISHANEQLHKMSDRYLLIRDDNQNNKELLELNVIDNYQAGEVRSCKNLSGGESFIISLALALGLSKMASQSNHKNITVDSLFLDEGFGTLDEDSLDIALDTLTNLQQQGKLIGVISHVQALKERIHTQIKVEKLSGGVSKLSGFGVQRLNG